MLRAILILACVQLLCAAEPQCFSKSKCQQVKEKDQLAQPAGAREGAVDAVDVTTSTGPSVLVRFPNMRANRKPGTALTASATADYHVRCSPDGKTSAVPDSPDVQKGSNSSEIQCASRERIAFKVHITATYTDKQGNQVTESKDAAAPQQDWTPNGEKCGPKTPRDDKCKTEI